MGWAGFSIWHWWYFMYTYWLLNALLMIICIHLEPKTLYQAKNKCSKTTQYNLIQYMCIRQANHNFRIYSTSINHPPVYLSILLSLIITNLKRLSLPRYEARLRSFLRSNSLAFPKSVVGDPNSNPRTFCSLSSFSRALISIRKHTFHLLSGGV